MEGFSIVPNPQPYCVSECNTQLYYQDSKCVAICQSNQIADDTYRACRLLNLCSILSEQGSNFHSSTVSNILIHKQANNNSNQVIISQSSNDNNIYLWDSTNGELISKVNIHSSAVLKIILIEQSNEILSFSQSGEVILWSLKNGQVIEKSNITFGQLTENSQVSESRNKICSFGFQGEFYINDLKNDSQKQFIGHSNIVQQIIFLNNDSNAITSSLDNTILYWDLQQINQFRLLCIHNGPPSQIDLMQNKFLFSFGGLGSDGYQIKITDISDSSQQCKSYQLDHKDIIIDVILDQKLSRVISFSSQDLIISSFSIEQPFFQSLQYFNKQKLQINQAESILKAILDQNILILYTQNGQLILFDYFDHIDQPSSSYLIPKYTSGQNQQQVSIDLNELTIKGAQISLQDNLLFVFGSQIYCISLDSLKLKYSINKLASSYIQHTQQVRYLDYEEESNISASTSLDGLTLVYDLTSGILLQKFIHPLYQNLNPSLYPQGLLVQISKIDGIVCVSYNDFSVVCFKGITKNLISSINMKESIINIQKDTSGKYLAIVTSNSINSYNIIAGQIDYQKIIQKGFSQSILTLQSQLFTISEDMALTYWAFPDLQVLFENKKIQSEYEPITFGKLQGFNIFIDYSYLIVYYSLGKVYLFDANLEFVKVSDEKTELSVYIVVCATGAPSRIIIRSFDDSYYFVDNQGYKLDPHIYVVVSYSFLKIFSVRNFGAFGGNIVVANLVDLSAEQSFYTNTVVIGLTIDETEQRVMYYEQSGQITISHFVPYTSSLLPRYNDTTAIRKVYLISQDNSLLILSNYLSTISFLDYTQLKFNQFHNLPPTDCLIDNQSGVIYSYNSDLQNNLQIWHYKTGEQIPLILQNKSQINGIVLSKSENILFCYTSDGQIILWDVLKISIIKVLSVNNGSNIINLLHYNLISPICISLGSDSNIVITNYQNGIIQRVITKNGSKNIMIDQDNQRLFILGQSISVYQAISGQKITEFLQFDGNVQQILIQENYLIAYANQVIMSIDRTSLQQLYTGKFTRQIFKIQIMKNLVGMIAYKENNQIEIWNYQSGIMLSSIVDQQFGNPYINLYSDEESNFLIAQNTLNILETVLPFEQTISPIKDLMYTQIGETGDVESVIIDKQTNKLIIQNRNQIEIRKYYTYLGDSGSSFTLPSNASVKQVYLKDQGKLFKINFKFNNKLWNFDKILIIKTILIQLDIIIYIDNERKSWQMKENRLIFIKRFDEYPNNFLIFLDYLIVSDSKTIQLLNTDLEQIENVQITYIQGIYSLESSQLLFAINENLQITQIFLDVQNIKMHILNTYDGTHTHRINNFVFNIQLNLFLVSDVSGLISIHNYKLLKTIQILKDNTKAIQYLILDSQLQLLITCSQDGNLNIYTFDENQNVFIASQNIQYSTAVMQIQYDEQIRQLFVWNSLQQNVQIFKYQEKQFILDSQILTPSDYGVQIKISSKLNLISLVCTFQINFYDWLNNFQFISYLRQPSSIFDIVDIIFLSRQLTIAVCRSQILVINISQQQAKIEKSLLSSYTEIIFSQFENDITIQLKGVNQMGIFNYTLVQELQTNDLSQTCYYSFKQTDTYFEWLKDLDLQIQSQQLQGNGSIKKQILTVEMKDDTEFNLVPTNLSQINTIKQIYTYSKEDDQVNSINIIFTNFLLFELEVIQIKDFIWNMDDYNLVSFNQKTQKVIFMNQSLQREFNGNSILLQNLNQVIMQNVVIQNSKFTNSNKQLADNPYFFTFENVNEVFIQNIKISKTSFSNQVLILIDSSGTITIDTLEIEQIYYSNIDPQQNQPQNLLFNLIEIRNCINLTIKNVVYKNIINDFNFIILKLTANQEVIIDQFQAYYCLNAILLAISPINQQQNKTTILQNDEVVLSKFQVSNCQSQEYYPLIYIQSNNIIIDNASFMDNSCLNSQGCSFQFKQSYFMIQNSNFTKQQSSQGGAISVQDTFRTSLIQNCIFQNNTAFIGGAIYLDNSDINILDSQITFNSAFIGGGIRYIIKIPSFILNMKNPQQRLITSEFNNITFNKAFVFGNNIGSYPRYMIVNSLNTTISSLSQKISSDKLEEIYEYLIDTFMSGGSLNIGIKLFDEEDNIVQYQPFQTIPDLVKKELNQYTINCLAGQDITLSGNTFFNYYNNSTSQFEISTLVLKGTPSTQRDFFIQNQFIYVPSVNQPQTLILQDVNIKVKINFRKCLVGEIYVPQTIDSPTYCMVCPEDKYSLIQQDPETKDQTCKLCPDTAYQCKGSTILLKNGYWRENDETDVIVYCKMDENNCKGQESNSINYCAPGYIGPLCEQCDLLGDVWESKYMNDGQHNCIACKDSLPLLFQYVGVALLSSLYLTYGIRQVIMTTIVKIQCYYLRRMKLVCVGKSESREQTDIYIKLLMHFMQVGSIVYQVKLPKIFQFFSVSIGSPLDTLKYSQDCRSVFLSQYIKPAYGRVLWQQIIALGYIQFLFLFYLVIVVSKLIRANKNYLVNGFIFVFLFTQPNIISGLTSMLTCRQIGEKQYIAGDVTLICYSDEHKLFIGYLIIPLFIFWAIILPFLWLYYLIVNKNKLDNSITRLRFGPLYQEYKKVTYYWEITKINLKMLIIFISTYFEDHDSIKGTLCTLILFLYLLLSFYKRPYISIEFNKIDQICNIVLIVCIQLNQFISISENTSFLEIASNYLLILINYSFMAYLIYKIIKFKLIRILIILFDNFSCVKNTFPNLIKTFSYKQKNAFRNWKKALKLLTIHLCHVKEQKFQIATSRYQLTKEIVYKNPLKYFTTRQSIKGGQEWDSLIQQYKISKEQNNQQANLQKNEDQNIIESVYNDKQTSFEVGKNANILSQNIIQDIEIQTPKASEAVLLYSPSVFKKQFLKKVNKSLDLQLHKEEYSDRSNSHSYILTNKTAQSQIENKNQEQKQPDQDLDSQKNQDGWQDIQSEKQAAMKELQLENSTENNLNFNYNFQRIIKFK